MPSISEAILEAFRFIGTPYVVGSSRLGVGADCSGLLKAALKKVGITTQGQTWRDWTSGVGQRVRTQDLNQMRPGDAIYFKTGNPRLANPENIGHVGIYLGNGMMIDASGKSKPTGVRPVGNTSRIAGFIRYADPVDRQISIPGGGVIMPGGGGGGSVGQGLPRMNLSDPVLIAADAAYQAGFRGQDLINMVAIVGGESSYNPGTVTKDSDDDSWGLWQINMRGTMGAPRRLMFGIRSNQELLDPYINAQVAMKIFKQQGYGGWGAYKNGSWRKFLSRAQTAAATVEASGGSMATVGRIAGAIGASLGNQVSPYGDYGGGVDAGGFETPSDTPFDAPGGGTVYTIAETNQAWVVYPIGNAKIAFAVSPNTNVAGLSNGGTISQNQFNALNIAVNGGLTNELSLMAGQEWGTYVDQLLMQLFGRNNPARNDPEVMAVVAELAGRPDMDPTEFQNRLKATQYYQKMTLAQAQWNDLPEAERAKQRDVVSLQMVDTIFELMGVVVGPSDPLIQQYLEDVASGKTGYGAFTAAIKAKALENPESPWGRQVRGEEEMQRLRPWEIENMALKVKEQARRWGVRMAPDKATEWATNIMNKTSSEDDLNEDLKAQALIRYPTKPKDMETDIWADQWKESYQRLLEKPADLFSPEIQQALTGEGVPLADFESKIMADPRWRGTKNGQAAIAQSLQSVGRIFGFTAGVQ